MVTTRTKQGYWSRVIGWLTLYLVFVLAPLAVASIGHDRPSRGFWIEFGVGLGFVGLAMMGLQFVLTARIRQIAAPFGVDAMLQFHRQAGYAAYGFILGHAIITIAAAPDRFLAYLDPTVNLPRAVALVTVLIVLTLLIALTLWRSQFRLSYEWWRVGHGVLALLAVFIGLGHVLMVAFYIDALWQQAVFVLLTVTAMGLLIEARVLRPMRMHKRPYRVTGVRAEAERTWTVSVEPVGHEGIRFEAGQFAWLTFGPSPYALEQHPFSLASSAEQKGSYEFTIKELGDFTSTVGRLEPGSPVFMEGPYGAFTLDPAPSVGATFVVGGIGITPVMSMLRTARARGDPRPLVLIYANKHERQIVFREELAELERDLNLKVMHVLEHPPDGWTGASGFVTREILARYRLKDGEHVEYFVCGPEPMMDLVEWALRGWGVPLRKLHAERFNIV